MRELVSKKTENQVFKKIKQSRKMEIEKKMRRGEKRRGEGRDHYNEAEMQSRAWDGAHVVSQVGSETEPRGQCYGAVTHLSPPAPDCHYFVTIYLS